MGDALFEAIKSLPGELVVIFLSLAPVSEVRGGIPAGLLLGVPLWRTLPLAVIFGTLAVVPILLWLEPLAQFLGRRRVLKRFFDWVFHHARKKSHFVHRYGVYGLTFLISLPIPGAGSWTGAVLAVLLGVPLWRSLLCVVVGLTIQATLVTLASMGLLQIPFVEKVVAEGIVLLVPSL